MYETLAAKEQKIALKAEVEANIASLQPLPRLKIITPSKFDTSRNFKIDQGVITCLLCGFECLNLNDHLAMTHFQDKLAMVLPRHLPPYTCPFSKCGFIAKNKQTFFEHYIGKHDILKKYLNEALAVKETKMRNKIFSKNIEDMIASLQPT